MALVVPLHQLLRSHELILRDDEWQAITATDLSNRNCDQAVKINRVSTESLLLITIDNY